MAKTDQAGTVTIQGGKLLVVDPCYAPAWKEHKLADKVRKGVPLGKHKYEAPGFQGIVVAVPNGVHPVEVAHNRGEIIKVSVDFGGTGSQHRVLGQVAKDTSHYMLLDPTLLGRWKDGSADTPDNHFYEVTNGISGPYGQAVNGKVFSFLVDNHADVVGVYDENGRIARLEIGLGQEDDSDTGH